MTIRRRTAAEKALAHVRRLNAPRKDEQRQREPPRHVYVWPSKAEVLEQFRTAGRIR